VTEEHQNLTMEELVDILAQKTRKFTQLMVYKDFGNEYKECKQAIQQILAEIELRKEKTFVQQNKATSA
jgi:HD-like signal output (HDOD) protein